nr:inositol transporter 4-like [Ipomoea batatas]
MSPTLLLLRLSVAVADLNDGRCRRQISRMLVAAPQMSPATMKNDGASEQGWCLRCFFPVSLYQEWSLRTQGWSTPPELSSHFAPPSNKLSTTPLPEKKRDQAASHAMVKLTLLACLVDQNKAEEVRAILEKIYPAINEVEEEMNGLKSSLEEEKCEESVIWYGLISKVKNAWRNTVVRRGLYVGITVQVAQNLVGIRMYYIPTILQLVGFASNTTTLALSLVTSDLNVVGTIIKSVFILPIPSFADFKLKPPLGDGFQTATSLQSALNLHSLSTPLS